MNLEGITLASLTHYLQDQLTGSKIYKISMPTPHSLLLMLKRERDTVALLAQAGGDSPTLYLPERVPENPDSPPAFCMLLRKHFEEGRLTQITQQGLDRVIEFQVDILGAGSKIITKSLIFELTGKNSNVIFTQEGQIVDSLKHVGAAVNSYRIIRPGVAYVAPPPQPGANILETDSDVIMTALPEMAPTGLPKQLITATTGIGKASAEQLFTLAKIPLATPILTPQDKISLAGALDNIKGQFSEQNIFTAIISKTNRCQTILPYRAVYIPEGCTTKEFTNINQAISYGVHLEPRQMPEQDLLQRLVATEITRLQKKLRVLDKDRDKAQGADKQRIIADSLMANIYQLKKGQSQCSIASIYDDTTLEIALSPLLSPSENAQAYYKKYSKLKRAQEEVALQLAEARELLEYMSSVEVTLVTATTKQELAEIKQELIAAGVIREVSKKKKMPMGKSTPTLVKFSESTLIYIGKNNKQNDYVTFGLGTGRDLWFHTKNIPGSHVLIKTSLPQPEPEAIEAAVLLAAYYSKGRSGSNVPVDCAQRRYVKKPAGAKPGFVIYTNQTTYYATPDEEQVKHYVRVL